MAPLSRICLTAPEREPPHRTGLQPYLLVGLALLCGCGVAKPERGPANVPTTSHEQSGTASDKPAMADDERGLLTPVAPNPGAKEPAMRARLVAGPEGLAELALDSFEPAVIALPQGAGPHPLVIAAHGAGGRAEWHCNHQRAIWGPNVMIACPRGKRRFAREPERGYYFPDHHALAAELRCLEALLRRQFGVRLRNTPALYVGYSQGASMGSLALLTELAAYQPWVLVEGGFNDWTRQAAQRYAQSGAGALLFVCGTSGCSKGARRSAQLLRAAGVRVILRDAPGAGHRPDGPVGRALVDGLQELLAAIPAWSNEKATAPSSLLPNGE